MYPQFIFLCFSHADVITKLTTAIPLPAGFTAHKLSWEMGAERWKLGAGQYWWKGPSVIHV